MIEREMARLERNFAGLTSLNQKAGAMLVIDTKKEAIAVTEAHTMGIPVIALMNTDCTVTDAEFPIVLNDASVTTVDVVLNALLSTYTA